MWLLLKIKIRNHLNTVFCINNMLKLSKTFSTHLMLPGLLKTLMNIVKIGCLRCIYFCRILFFIFLVLYSFCCFLNLNYENNLTFLIAKELSFTNNICDIIACLTIGKITTDQVTYRGLPIAS